VSRGQAKGVRWPGREPGTMPEDERLRRCASQQVAMNRPEVRAKLSAKAKASWDDPAVRARRAAAQAQASADTTTSQRRSEAGKRAWARRKAAQP
jgi:hypothetical protein